MLKDILKIFDDIVANSDKEYENVTDEDLLNQMKAYNRGYAYAVEQLKEMIVRFGDEDLYRSAGIVDLSK